MRQPPFYPPWLVRVTSFSRGKLGRARFNCSGWTFQFTGNGSLRVSAPNSAYVLDMGPDETESFVDLVSALDAGRYEHHDWEANA